MWTYDPVSITSYSNEIFIESNPQKAWIAYNDELVLWTVKQILERVSSVMIDREAIKDLVKFVTEVLYFFTYWIVLPLLFWFLLLNNSRNSDYILYIL